MRKSIAGLKPVWVKMAGVALAAVFGFGLVALAADSVIDFPGAKFVGTFGHTGSFRAESNLTPPYVYAQIAKGGWGTALNVHATLKDGSYIDIKITDPTNKLSKVPQTYPIADNQSPGDKFNKKAYATIEYHGQVVCWSKESGTLTLNAMGAIDAPVTGKIEGMHWYSQGSRSNEACNKLGSNASFRTQRSEDR